MDKEKMTSLIARKENEIKVLEEKESFIRKGITDVDYSEFEYKHRKEWYFFNKLPKKIINKLRPMWNEADKLRAEIECIEKILNNSEEYNGEIIGCTRVGISDMLRCQDCEYKPHSFECVERRMRRGNGYVIQ